MAAFSSAIVVAAVGLIGVVQPAAAQTGRGFIYGGVIAPLDTGERPSEALTFGGGLEALTRSGAGASLEAGLFVFDFRGFSLPLLSANAIYEKPTRESRVSPFISGGLTLGGQLINFGGGANIWTHERAGFRIEVRDYVQPANAEQMIAFRVGATFR